MMIKKDEFSTREKIHITLAIRNTQRNLVFLKNRLAKDLTAAQAIDLVDDMCDMFPYLGKFMQLKIGMNSLEAKELARDRDEVNCWDFFKQAIEEHHR